MNIDALKEYEVVGRSADKKKLCYIVMLFTPQKSYFLLVGFASQRYEEVLTMFRDVAKTFRQK